MNSRLTRAIAKGRRMACSVESLSYRRGLRRLPSGVDVCILDPWYTGLEGHHECYNAALSAACDRRGLRSVVLSSFRVRSSSKPKRRCIPLFACQPYGHFSTAPSLLDSVSQTTATMLAGLRILSRDWSARMPSMILHTGAFHHFFAIADWLERTAPPATRLSMMVHYAPDMMAAPPVSELARALFITGLNRLLAAGAGKMKILTSAHSVSEHFVELGAPLLPVGPPAIEFPDPLPSLPAGIAAALRRSGDAPVMVFVGSGRHEKGLHLLFEAWQKLSSHPRDARCVVIITESLAELGLTPPAGCDSTLTMFERVKLSPGQMLAVMAASDCVLLPYDPERYRNRQSNILLEAAGVGTPFISTGGQSSLQRESEALGIRGTVWMHEYSAAALADAVRRFERESRALGEAAKASAPRFRASFGGDALLNMLLGASQRADVDGECL